LCSRLYLVFRPCFAADGRGGCSVADACIVPFEVFDIIDTPELARAMGGFCTELLILLLATMKEFICLLEFD